MMVWGVEKGWRGNFCGDGAILFLVGKWVKMGVLRLD
jgi:hypothetical protein